MITRPTGMQLREWADRVTQDLDIYGVAGRILGDNWQDWAAQFLNNASIKGNLPNPYQFADWREWAERLCEVLA